MPNVPILTSAVNRPLSLRIWTGDLRCSSAILACHNPLVYRLSRSPKPVGPVPSFSYGLNPFSRPLKLRLNKLTLLTIGGGSSPSPSLARNQPNNLLKIPPPARRPPSTWLQSRANFVETTAKFWYPWIALKFYTQLAATTLISTILCTLIPPPPIIRLCGLCELNYSPRLLP